MTELLFAGGVVRIDENHVWRELAAWVASTDGYGSVTFWQNGGKWQALLLTEAGGAEYRGASRLGMADAVAQALQVAAAAKLVRTPGDAARLDQDGGR